MLRTSRPLLAIMLLLGSPTGLIAQETQRITAAPLANGFYGEYKIVEDHPTCNAADEIAFRVSVNLSNVMFRARAIHDGEILEFGLPEETANPICYLRERRGVETLLLEVPCTASRLQTRRNAIQRITAELDLTADVTSCLSPLGHENLGGSWSATLRQPNSETTTSGALGHGSEVQVETNIGKSRVTHHVLRDQWNFWVNSTYRHPIARSLNNAPAINLELACMPFALEGRGDQLHLLSSSVWLFLAKEVPDLCSGPDCPVLNDAVRTSFSFRNCGDQS